MYKIRIVLDSEEDIIRTVLVNDDINLEALHQTITKSFNFEGFEMASFYRTDNEWNEGEEIPSPASDILKRGISSPSFHSLSVL